MDTLTESISFNETSFNTALANDIPDHVHVDFWLRDVDLVQPLLEYPEGRERDDFICRALRIGILALRQAQARIDTDSVRRRGRTLDQPVG